MGRGNGIPPHKVTYKDQESSGATQALLPPHALFEEKLSAKLRSRYDT
jgi:hypothetical protein